MLLHGMALVTKNVYGDVQQQISHKVTENSRFPSIPVNHLSLYFGEINIDIILYAVFSVLWQKKFWTTFGIFLNVYSKTRYARLQHQL